MRRGLGLSGYARGLAARPDTAAGETVAGACLTTPEPLPDGRLRLTERWRRLDGSTGVSHLEEVAP